ncbi:hypothetical protein FOA52_013975 [Chlamydomonas sp. UWO 241]|nr:hypothetical protein FOA52_013975 [Chlamydomonas sp. UWO 241]
MSVVYFKFRAQLSFDSILFDGHFISIGELKRLICAKKSIADAAELHLSDPKTKEEYREDSAQLPKGTQVIVRRIPANAQSRVLVGATPVPQASTAAPAAQATASGRGAQQAEAFARPHAHADPFGADPFAQAQASLAEEQAAARNAAMVAGSGEGGGGGRGGGGRGGWGAGGRGGGRGKPPPSYYCRRCAEEGKHWEKDCPTVGDPAYDFKVTRMPTGIPITKLTRNADGALVLPTGEMGALVENTTAFQRQIALMSGQQPAEEVPVGVLATHLHAKRAREALAASSAGAGLLALPSAPGEGTAPAGPHGEGAAGPHGAAWGAAPHEAVAGGAGVKLEVGTAEVAAAGGGGGAGDTGGALAGHAAPSKPGLFDDDEPDHAAAPILLSSTGMRADEVAPAAKASPAANGAMSVVVQMQHPPALVMTAPPVPEDQLVLIPPDLRMPFCSADDLWTYKNALQPVLPPRTAMTLCIEAFGQGRPLTREEFARFQKENSRARTRSRSRSRSRAVRQRSRSARRSRSRGGGERHRSSRGEERHRERSRERERSRGHDRSRERARPSERERERERASERERERERERASERGRASERERERPSERPSKLQEQARARSPVNFVKVDIARTQGLRELHRLEREGRLTRPRQEPVDDSVAPPSRSHHRERSVHRERERERSEPQEQERSHGAAEANGDRRGGAKPASPAAAGADGRDEEAAGHKRTRASNGDGVSPSKSGRAEDRYQDRSEPAAGPSNGPPPVVPDAAPPSELHSTEGAKGAAQSNGSSPGRGEDIVESKEQEHKSPKHRRHREHKDADPDRDRKKRKKSSHHRERSSGGRGGDENGSPSRRRSDEGAGRSSKSRRSDKDKDPEKAARRAKAKAEREKEREARREAKPGGRLLAHAMRAVRDLTSR